MNYFWEVVKSRIDLHDNRSRERIVNEVVNIKYTQYNF